MGIRNWFRYSVWVMVQGYTKIECIKGIFLAGSNFWSSACLHTTNLVLLSNKVLYASFTFPIGQLGPTANYVRVIHEPARGGDAERFSQQFWSGMPGVILGHPFLMSEHLSIDEPLKCYHRRPATGEISSTYCMCRTICEWPWQDVAYPLRLLEKAFRT